jgi:SRSO17 transposase
MSASVAWEHELQSWLEPFLKPLRHPARRRMCSLYVVGLISPGERKSLQPMATWVAPADYDQLHHFVGSDRGMRRPSRPNAWFRPIGSSAGLTLSW